MCMYIYIYIYRYIDMYVYIYIYIHIEREIYTRRGVSNPTVYRFPQSPSFETVVCIP